MCGQFMVLSWGFCLSWHQPQVREARHATVHGVEKSQTQFSDSKTAIFISALLIADSVTVGRLSILYSRDSQCQHYCHFQPSNTLLFILGAVEEVYCVYWRMLSSTSGFYSIVSSSNLSVIAIKSALNIKKYFLGDKSTMLVSHWYRPS